MKRLRVKQGHIGDRVTGRSNLITHEANDRELMTMSAERNFLAKRKAGGAIDDDFVMTANDIPSSDESARTAWPIKLIANEEDAQRVSIEFGLDRLVGNGAGALDAIDPADQFSRIAWYAGGLGKWSIGAGFNHPKISVGSTRLPQRIIDQAAINARNHNNDAQ